MHDEYAPALGITVVLLLMPAAIAMPNYEEYCKEQIQYKVEVEK